MFSYVTKLKSCLFWGLLWFEKSTIYFDIRNIIKSLIYHLLLFRFLFETFWGSFFSFFLEVFSATLGLLLIRVHKPAPKTTIITKMKAITNFLLLDFGSITYFLSFRSWEFVILIFFSSVYSDPLASYRGVSLVSTFKFASLVTTNSSIYLPISI